MHLEFVVPGPPISNQSKNQARLAAWQAAVAQEAAKWWTAPVLTARLKAVIVNFHTDDKPPLDVDNMSKPILDALQGVVFKDDRQVRQAEITHVRIGVPLVFVKVSKLIVAAVQTGEQFVYVRIEDPVDPFPLPK